MSHTPGPWTAAADKTLEGLNVYTITGPGVCGWVADVNRAAWQKSSEANAKLIAAAPDLLKALQFYANPDNWIRDYSQSYLAGAEGGEASIAETDAGELAVEAIRKAIG